MEQAGDDQLAAGALLERDQPSVSVIEVESASLHLGGDDGAIEIYSGIDLTLSRGEVLAIVGPSGCGKTMFLHTLVGAEVASQGVVRVFGAAPRFGDRRMGYAMARDALMPWRTASQNVELALEGRGIGREERRAMAIEALKSVRLEGFADSYQSQLSQGMRQRVALARTFVAQPELLLLDEPFAALDAQTRIRMQEQLVNMLARSNSSAVIVTHDIEEAVSVANRVVLFSQRPARVKFSLSVPENWPKDVEQRRSHPQFHEMVTRLWQELASELE